MKNYAFWVYILASYNSNVLYVGITNNLERRLSEHKLELVEGFSKKYQCKKLVYYENFDDIKQAIAREKYLKGKTRNYKDKLINEINPEWKDLSNDWV